MALGAIRLVHEGDDMESCVIAAARASLPKIKAVTWERVRDETARDIHLLLLMDMAKNGFPTSPHSIPHSSYLTGGFGKNCQWLMVF